MLDLRKNLRLTYKVENSCLELGNFWTLSQPESLLSMANAQDSALFRIRNPGHAGATIT